MHLHSILGIALALSAQVSLACDTGARPAKPAGLTTYFTGNAADVCPEMVEGGLLLMGGGPDVDAAFSRRVKPRLQGGDVVVLRTSGSDGYNDYLHRLLQADSVETLLVDRREYANDPYVVQAVERAEFVWLAGGDQSDYLNQWQGTALQHALDAVLARGAVLGGTSAGATVQSQYVYDPDGVPGALSSEAVTDLCHANNNISSGFLTTPVMQGLIVDTHFAERDRLGRLAVFMAGLPGGVRGIGIDESTSIFFSADGVGVVDGRGSVYVLAEDAHTVRAQAQCRRPVVYEDLLRFRLSEGDTYSLPGGASSATPRRIGVNGSSRKFYRSRPYR